MPTESNRDLEHAIRLDEVVKLYSTRDRATVALRNLSFTVARGEYVCVLGRADCGKSTIVNLLLGLGGVTSGQVSVLGFDPQRDAAALHGRVGCLFHADRMLPWRNAIDNAPLPMAILSPDDSDAPAADAPVEPWLPRLRLQAFAYALPQADRLFGRARARVAQVQALRADPELLLADDTFGHLEEVTARSLRQEFRVLSKQRGTTVLHVTPAVDEALEVADRILVLGKPGHVAASFEGVRSLTSVERALLREDIQSRVRAAERVDISVPGEAGVPVHLW